MVAPRAARWMNVESSREVEEMGQQPDKGRLIKANLPLGIRGQRQRRETAMPEYAGGGTDVHGSEKGGLGNPRYRAPKIRTGDEKVAAPKAWRH